MIHALDRLARKQAHNVILFEEAEGHGVEIISATEEIAKTPEGELIRSIKSYVAEVERIKIMERTQHRTTAWSRRARSPAPAPPATVITTTPPRGPARSTRPPAPWSNASSPWPADIGAGHRGDPDRRGHPQPEHHKVYKDGRTPRWCNFTVISILRDRSYIGEPMMLNKSTTYRKSADQIAADKKRSKTGVTRLKAQTRRAPRGLGRAEGWPRGEHTVIVNPEVFKTANLKIKKRVGYSKTRNDKHPYLLRGMIVCGVCGQNFTPHHIRNRTRSPAVVTTTTYA